MRRNAKGFTLVEVLVVIGIIAILISLLLPAIGRSRKQAQTVKCMSNLRQMGMSVNLFANNNRGKTPAWSGVQIAGGDGAFPDTPGLGWPEATEPYSTRPDSDVYHCPSFPTEHKNTYFLSARYSFFTGRQELKVGEMLAASQFILAGECTLPLFYPMPFGTSALAADLDDCDKDDATNKCLLFGTDTGGLNIHPAGNNVLFADGHVATFAKFDPQFMTYHPKRVGKTWEDLDKNNPGPGVQ